MADRFGFGVQVRSRRFGGPGGGLFDVIDSLSGNNLEGYSSSGQMDRDIEEAVTGFEKGDGAGFQKVRNNLLRYGMRPEQINDFLKGHLSDRATMRENADRQRQDQERQAVLKEIMPRPAEYGFATPGSEGLRDEDESQEVVETAPGYAGRAPTQADFLRMAGRKAFDSMAGSDDFLTIPQKQFQLGEQARASGATADLRQTQNNLLKDPAAQIRAQMGALEQMDLEMGGEGGRDVGYTITPRGLTLRNNPQRRAVNARDRIFNETYDKTGNLDEAIKAVADYDRQIGVARGSGAQQGALDVRRTPEFLANRSDIAKADESGKPLPPAIQTQMSTLDLVTQTIDSIASNLDDSFLGPVKGTDTAFQTRRTFGETIGSPLSEREVVFRQAIKDANDQLLRARSGAAITEQEYNRLASMLPKPTDEPKVFRAGLKRFKDQMTALRSEKLKLGTTPRNQLGTNEPGPRAVPKVIGIERVE